MNKNLQDKIDFVIGEAQEAFWAVVADNFPECPTGDLDPIASFNFDVECSKVVTQWVFTNSEVIAKARELCEVIDEAYEKIAKASTEFMTAQGQSRDYVEHNGMVVHSLLSMRSAGKAIEKDTFICEDEEAD